MYIVKEDILRYLSDELVKDRSHKVKIENVIEDIIENIERGHFDNIEGSVTTIEKLTPEQMRSSMEKKRRGEYE